MKKLGLTIHPVHRMRVYNTGDAPGIGLEKRYDGIWQVNANNTQTLFQYERCLHEHFHARRQTRWNGNYTEWFSLTYEEVKVFLQSQTFVTKEISLEEIAHIHTQSECEPTKEEWPQFVEELSFLREQEQEREQEYTRNERQSILSTRSLQDEFFATFL
jgi:hypothetical protein